MTTIAEITKRLEKFKSSSPSKWKEEANERIQNRQELRNTQTLAMTIIDMMDKISKTELSKRLNVSIEYLENILHCQIFMSDFEKEVLEKKLNTDI